MIHVAAMLTGILFVACFIIVVMVSTRIHIKEAHRVAQKRQQEREKGQALSIQLSPAYQDMLAAEREYELKLKEHDLKRQHQTVNLTILQGDFQLRQYLALHRITAETYSVNEEMGTVIPFPSLKPQAADRAAIAGAGAAPLQIPAAYDMLDIFQTQPITPESIFLAKGPQENLFVKADQLHHAAFSASTGYGKTTLIRGIIPQLLHINHHVVIADLKYTDFTEKGDDWRPIAARIFEQSPLQLTDGYRLPSILRREEEIAALLHWLAYPEMQRRLDMRASRNYSYPTLDIFLEELIALTLAYPSVSKDIIRIISLGRELRLNLLTTAQNMQVSSIGLSGGAREQFTTAWFLGGDETSAAALLDMTRKELTDFLHGNNIVLGQGIGMMRNNYVLPTAGIVRLGMSSNNSIYHLLGKADDFELARAEERQQKNRSYSVPSSSAEERLTSSPRNAQEPDTEPLETTLAAVPEERQTVEYSPFLLFTEEQRTAILAAARQPDMSLKKIRSAAKIGNDSNRWKALKLWLEMNQCQIGA